MSSIQICVPHQLLGVRRPSGEVLPFFQEGDPLGPAREYSVREQDEDVEDDNGDLRDWVLLNC